MVQIDLIFPVSLNYGDILVEPLLRLCVNKLNSLAIISQSLQQFQPIQLRHPLQMNKKMYICSRNVYLFYHRPDLLSPLADFS